MARLPWLDPKQLGRTYVPRPEIRELKIQVNQRNSMVKQLVDLKNQLIAYANAVWPGISRAFGDLDSAHARSFLREQRPKTIATLQVDELAELLEGEGTNSEELCQAFGRQVVGHRATNPRPASSLA